MSAARLAFGGRLAATGDAFPIGLSFAMLTIKNPLRPDLAEISVEALADTGSVYLIIPEHLQLQLGLEPVSSKEVTLADDSKKWCPMSDP